MAIDVNKEFVLGVERSRVNGQNEHVFFKIFLVKGMQF